MMDRFIQKHGELQFAKLLEHQLTGNCYGIISKYLLPDFKTRYHQEIKKYWYPNGQLWCEFHYREGKLHGLSRHWCPNGQLKYEANFQEGELHGTSRGWYPNGQPWYEANFREGKQHGLYREWCRDGQLRYEDNWREGRRSLRQSEKMKFLSIFDEQ
jgi:antitoxin component YwqK of YwqJK toxin-antitoxin module